MHKNSCKQKRTATKYLFQKNVSIFYDGSIFYPTPSIDPMECEIKLKVNQTKRIQNP